MQSEFAANRFLELRNSNGRLRATVELTKVADRIEGALKLHNLNGGGAGGKPSGTECLDVYYHGGRLRIELENNQISLWDFLGKRLLTLRTMPTRIRLDESESAQSVTQLVGVTDRKNRLGVALVSDPEGLGDIAPWRLRLLMLERHVC